MSRAGRRRSYITITRPTISGQDEYGQDEYGTATTIGNFFADVQALRGREFEAVQQKWAEARFKVVINFPYATIQRKDQITWGARTLDILDAEDPDQRRRDFVMYCRELVS